MTPLRSCCREPWWLSGGLLPGETVVCLCPPLSREMGDCLQQHLDAALEGGTAGRRGEEEEEKEEKKGAGEWLWQQGLPQARCSSKFLKRPQPLFQGLR